MKIRHIPCGDFVNESERRAFGHLKAKLQSVTGPWVLLSNLSHAQYTGRRADEIDILAVGPPGVHASIDWTGPAAIDSSTKNCNRSSAMPRPARRGSFASCV